MRDIALLIVLLALIPYIIKRPFWGVLTWCWVSYMVPHKLTFGFMWSFPIAQMVGILAFAAYLFSREKKSIPWSMPIIFLVMLYIWMFFTYLAHDKTAFVDVLAMKVLKIQFFTLVILAMLTTKERINQALLVIALSIGFYGLDGGIRTILSGGSSRIWGPPGGFFYGNNELGLTLVMVMPIMLYLMTQYTKTWMKLGFAAIMFFSAFSVLGTQSRGAFLSICACLFFLWLKSNHKFILGLAFIICLPVGYSFMPQSWHDRMDTIFVEDTEEYDGSVKGRLNAWGMAINIANDKVFGGGFNAATPENFILYAPDPLDFHDFHSIYFQMLGKHGWTGLILYLLMYGTAWLMASRVRRRTKKIESLRWAYFLCGMLQVSLVAFATGGAFLGLAYFDLPFHFLITIVATNAIVNKQLKKDAEKQKANQNTLHGQAVKSEQVCTPS